MGREQDEKRMASEQDDNRRKLKKAVQAVQAAGSAGAEKAVRPTASFAKTEPAEYRNTAARATRTANTKHMYLGQHKTNVVRNWQEQV